MAEILITKPKVLSPTDKSALRKAGIVVVEAAEPTEVRFIRAQSELDSSDLALAAMKALDKASGASGEKSLFVKLVSEALAKKEARDGSR